MPSDNEETKLEGKVLFWDSHRNYGRVLAEDGNRYYITPRNIIFSEVDKQVYGCPVRFERSEMLPKNPGDVPFAAFVEIQRKDNDGQRART
jgi:hypothetical protein